MERLAIVADDLTGALDAAVGGAGRGSVRVVLGGDLPWPDADVLAVDTGTRHLPPSEARERVSAVVARVVETGRTPFLKIDSLLRGNVGIEVAAALDALGAMWQVALVAPAFPATGRTTAGGVVHLDGVPIAAGAHGGRIADALAVAALTASHAPVPADAGVLAGSIERAQRQGVRALVVDASTDRHLAHVVAAARQLGAPPLLVGSGGLAAQLLGQPAPAAAAGPRGYGVPRVLTVVGGHSTVARAQIDALVGAGARRIHPACSHAPSAGDLVLTPDPGRPLVSAHAAAIASDLGALAAELAPGFGALVLTGGETARAPCSTRSGCAPSTSSASWSRVSCSVGCRARPRCS